MSHEVYREILFEIRSISRQCGSLSDFVVALNELFAREFKTEEEFVGFFKSAEYRKFVELLVTEHGESLDPNHPEVFLQLVPDSVRSEIDQMDVECGLFGAHWGRGPSELLEAIGLTNSFKEPETGPLSLYFDLDDFNSLEIAEVLALISDIYRSLGGDALVIDDCYFTSMQELAEVPQ
jgi:hypothetical protein